MIYMRMYITHMSYLAGQFTLFVGLEDQGTDFVLIKRP